MGPVTAIWFANRHPVGSTPTELENGVRFAHDAFGQIWATKSFLRNEADTSGRVTFATRPLAFLRSLTRLLPSAPAEAVEFLRPHLVHGHNIDKLLGHSEPYPVSISATHYCAIGYIMGHYVYGAVIVDACWETFLCPRPADGTDIEVALEHLPSNRFPPPDHAQPALI